MIADYHASIAMRNFANQPLMSNWLYFSWVGVEEYEHAGREREVTLKNDEFARIWVTQGKNVMDRSRPSSDEEVPR